MHKITLSATCGPRANSWSSLEHSGTCAWQHSPGDKGHQDATKRPEDEQPAEVLAAICLAQELTVISEDDGQRTTDTVGEKRKSYYTIHTSEF
jgi:hypothetical protein